MVHFFLSLSMLLPHRAYFPTALHASTHCAPLPFVLTPPVEPPSLHSSGCRPRLPPCPTMARSQPPSPTEVGARSPSLTQEGAQTTTADGQHAGTTWVLDASLEETSLPSGFTSSPTYPAVAGPWPPSPMMMTPSEHMPMARTRSSCSCVLFPKDIEGKPQQILSYQC
jgi:hypothetical protein